MHVDPDADHHRHCVGQAFGLDLCLNENAAGFARADLGDRWASADRLSGRKRRGWLRQPRARLLTAERQVRCGNLRAEENADVESLAGGGDPP